MAAAPPRTILPVAVLLRLAFFVSIISEFTMNHLAYVPFIACMLSWTSIVHAHNPVEFLEVLPCVPATMIEHDVELKSSIDDSRHKIELAGPTHFSNAVGCMNRSAKGQKAHLTWYKIANSVEGRTREVSVVDLVNGSNSIPLKVGRAEYFLSPAQRITTGPPAEVPDGLDRYTAYKILNPKMTNLDVVLSESIGPAKRNVRNPVFLCIATEEWHHEQHFDATHARDCFIAYELGKTKYVGTVNSMDQFGLHQMKAQGGGYLLVKATFSKIE